MTPTPIYILRATRKYAKNNREKINIYRRRKWFYNTVKTILEAELDEDEKLRKISKVKNFGVYENEDELMELLHKKLI